MTTPAPPATTAIPSARAPRYLRPLLALALAAGPILPASAYTSLAADSADSLPGVSLSQQIARTTPAADHEMLFAADVSQLIAAGETLPVLESGAASAQPKRTLLQRGLALLGTPYRWGGNSPDGGFDCSGLVSYVFRTALGIELPRVSRDMANAGEQVERSQLDAGDLVFFGLRGSRIDHVGIYLGNGRFLHAPRTGRDVTVSSLDTGYWARRFKLARRVTDA